MGKNSIPIYKSDGGGAGEAFGKHNLEKPDSRSTEASPEGIGGGGNALPEQL